MYFLGVIYVCFITDCYFLESPVLYTIEEQCYYELNQQLQYLASEGIFADGLCFTIEIPGVEI